MEVSIDDRYLTLTEKKTKVENYASHVARRYVAFSISQSLLFRGAEFVYLVLIDCLFPQRAGNWTEETRCAILTCPQFFCIRKTIALPSPVWIKTKSF